jgi:hypothetical protein
MCEVITHCSFDLLSISDLHFICLWVICMSLSEICQFICLLDLMVLLATQGLTHAREAFYYQASVLVPFPFFEGYFWLSNCSSLYSLDTNPLSDKWLTNTFSHPVHFPFSLWSPCLCRSFLVDVVPSIYFVACAFGITSKKSWPFQYHEMFLCSFLLVLQF